MDRLEMLTQREQLMEDIDCIVFEFFDEHYNMDDDYRSEKDDLVRVLCDAVCKNFPAEWRQQQQLIQFKLQNQMDLRRF